MELILPKVVNKQKLNPLNVPPGECIVTIEEEANNIESLMVMCLDNRNWFNITCAPIESRL